MAKRGPKRILSDEQQCISAGWVVYRNIFRKDTSNEKLKTFMLEKFGASTNPTYLSRFNKKSHLSSRLVSKSSPSEYSKIRYRQAIEFLSRIRNKRKKPHQIVCLDKTSIYCDARYSRQLAPKGRYFYLLFYSHS